MLLRNRDWDAERLGDVSRATGWSRQGWDRKQGSSHDLSASLPPAATRLKPLGLLEVKGDAPKSQYAGDINIRPEY